MTWQTLRGRSAAIVLALAAGLLAGSVGSVVTKHAAQGAFTSASITTEATMPTFDQTPSPVETGRVVAVTSSLLSILTLHGQDLEVATSPTTMYYVHPDLFPVSRSAVTIGAFIVAQGTVHKRSLLAADSITVIPNFRGARPGFEPDRRPTPYP